MSRLEDCDGGRRQKDVMIHTQQTVVSESHEFCM